jgi:hypothetical protein
MPDQFLESYAGQSTDELLALAGKYRIDSLVLAFEQAIQQKTDPSTNESYVLAVEGLEREVNNGGYSQFFLNSSGEFAGIIEAALRAINCPNTADITRDAIKAIAGDGELSASMLSDRAANADETLERALAACDDRYFSNDEPIADRLFDWIKTNRSSIRIGGT